MAWADLKYYEDEYLMGRVPGIPDTDFPFWEKQAETKINWRRVTVDNPQDCLKECVCEVAELLYRKAPDTEVHSAVLKHLSRTDYHHDFVYRGI